MKLKDLLLVADCNYHVFFKTDILNMTVLRVDQEWNITIG